MAVDIRFFNTNDEEISLDKLTGGVDFGIVRKGQQHVFPVVIKNLGDTNAENISIMSSALNSPLDVSPEEYNQEVLASNWKMFSHFPNRSFVHELLLRDIAAGQTLKGYKEMVETFSNPANSAFVNDVRATHVWRWTGNSLTCSPAEGVTSYFAKADSPGWGDNQDVDFVTRFNMPNTVSPGQAFTFFGFRMNSMGDDKGYLITVKRTQSTNTMFFEVRKAEGVRANGSTSFGTVLALTNNIPWINNAQLRIKVFNNENGKPEIKIWYNSIDDSDTPVQWATLGDSYIDNDASYPHAGGIRLIFGTAVGGDFEISEASLVTDDEVGKVYIRTLVGDGAVDSLEYKSAMEVFYDTEDER